MCNYSITKAIFQGIPNSFVVAVVKIVSYLECCCQPSASNFNDMRDRQGLWNQHAWISVIIRKGWSFSSNSVFFRYSSVTNIKKKKLMEHSGILTADFFFLISKKRNFALQVPEQWQDQNLNFKLNFHWSCISLCFHLQ